MEFMKAFYFKTGIPEGLTNSISISLADESVFGTFNHGDYIAVVGKVDTKALGTLMIDYAVVGYAGEDDLKLMRERDNSRAEILAAEIRDYKETAETVSYNDLVREPSKYEGKVIKATIRISQIMGGGFLTEAGYAGYQGDNQWYIHYEIPEDVPRILEGDSVTFYGEYAGVEEMTRSIGGSKVYVPKMDAKYHAIN
jgi:hypothetical protein